MEMVCLYIITCSFVITALSLVKIASKKEEINVCVLIDKKKGKK
jgi:hypothetical protein